MTVMCSWGKCWTITYRETQKPAATFEAPLAKAGVESKCRVLHLSPAHRTTQAPPPPDPRTCLLPSPHGRSQLPALGEQARGPVTCFHCRCCSRSPNKACLNFLSGPSSIAVDRVRPRTRGDIQSPGDGQTPSLSSFQE